MVSATTAVDVGSTVRDARLRRGLTQAELAERIGVSREWVVRLERGHPRLELQLVLDALAEAGVDVVLSARPIHDHVPSDETDGADA